jgi:hypothetical protein
LRIVQQMASALPYTDTCEDCAPSRAPSSGRQRSWTPTRVRRPTAWMSRTDGPGPLPVPRVPYPLGLRVLGRRSAILTRWCGGHDRSPGLTHTVHGHAG